ncbi:MAG: OmpA family protein [Bacteroidetes bacterium]|nr:OmpA family protein [Bacteroidota bacterium]
MKSIVLYIIILHVYCIKTCFAQESDKLTVGEKAPGLVLASTNNSILSFSFPYQNKVTLLFFWSSSVAKSKENIYKYKRILAKYSDIGYKTCDGFELISVALQSDKNAWNQDLIKYDLLNINNCIAQRGYNDLFVIRYKLTETPASFLIDETGRIVEINPDIKTIISFLDQKRNVELSTDIQTQLTGTIKYGAGVLSPLANQRICFLNEKRDTLQTTILNDKGGFAIKNINTTASLYLYLFPNPSISDEQTVFLTSENGEIVSPFKKNDNKAYEYHLLDAEMPYLKPMADEPAIKNPSDKSIKDLYMSGQIFKGKETIVPKESMVALNQMVARLKEHPKTYVEIISHTDSNGDAKSNSSLTTKQSVAIAAYLTSKGIAKSRLKPIGKGEDEPVNACKDGVNCSETEHHQNRRTEFKFYTQ